MEPKDAREQYYKSLETIKELKKQNNTLNETVKKLKTRLRWPENVKVAVHSKEVLAYQKNMEQDLIMLTNQCKMYEKEVQKLRAMKANPVEPSAAAGDQAANSANTRELNHRNQLNKAEACAASLKSSMDRSLIEWKEKENTYKQQIEETNTRLQQTEDRLTHLLRLRTLDSTELIRLARANKIKSAEAMTLQDENHRLKNIVEDNRTKFDEIYAQLDQEQKRREELQEEAAQVQLSKHSMHDLLQELEEVKKEREMLRDHLKSSLAEVAKASEQVQEGSTFQEQITSLNSQIDELQKLVSEERASKQWLSLQLDEQRRDNVEHKRKLIEKTSKLKEMLEKQIRSTQPGPVEMRKISTNEQGTQTVNFDIDFKPPDVACGLSAEEGDRILAQMHLEIESHRELVRTQTRLAQLFKTEMDSLHEQLKAERVQYASELAQKMARIQEMQALLQSHNSSCEPNVNEKKIPVPTPRRYVTIVENEKYQGGVEIEIQSLTATAKSPLLADDHAVRLFIEYALTPNCSSSNRETPGNFFRPSQAGTKVNINYTDHWTADELAQTSHAIFNIVGDPYTRDDEDLSDCVDFGSAALSIANVTESFQKEDEIYVELPITTEDDAVIGHLNVIARQFQ